MVDSEQPRNEVWKKFLRRHWKATLLLIGAMAGAVAVTLLVFLWILADAQVTGLVPAMLGQWTVGYLITFILTLLLWELVLMVSWVAPLGVAIYFLWYKKMPQEERDEYEGAPRRGRSARGSSGFSFFIGLIWLIIVWTSGRWNLAFQVWTINDFVFSWLTALFWVLLIVGIPGTIYVIWALAKNQTT